MLTLLMRMSRRPTSPTDIHVFAFPSTFIYFPLDRRSCLFFYTSIHTVPFISTFISSTSHRQSYPCLLKRLLSPHPALSYPANIGLAPSFVQRRGEIKASFLIILLSFRIRPLRGFKGSRRDRVRDHYVDH